MLSTAFEAYAAYYSRRHCRSGLQAYILKSKCGAMQSPARRETRTPESGPLWAFETAKSAPNIARTIYLRILDWMGLATGPDTGDANDETKYCEVGRFSRNIGLGWLGRTDRCRRTIE